MIRKYISRFVERLQATLLIWWDDNIYVCTVSTKPDSTGEHNRSSSACCIIQVDDKLRKPFCEASIEMLEIELNKQNLGSMKYIVLELFPEPHVVQNPETGTPYYFEYIDEAMAEARNCQRGQVVKIQD